MRNRRVPGTGGSFASLHALRRGPSKAARPGILGIVGASGILLILLTPFPLAQGQRIVPPTPALASIASPSPNTGDDWPSYLHDAERTGGNSAERSLTVANVSSLVPVWEFHTGGLIAASPVVSKGVLYVGSWDGYEYALNATSGTLLWRTFLNQTFTSNCPYHRGVTSTPSVSGSTLYLGGGDAYWYALNASTGAVEWRLFVGNTSVGSGHYNWASPLLYAGNAYIGVASDCDTPLVQGGLLQANLSSHAVVHQFNTSTARLHGASVWGSPSVDPRTNAVYFATGNGGFDGDSVLAVNATTLALKGNWTVPASQQISDGDFGSTPTVFTTAAGHAMIGVASKNGIFYAFDDANVSAGPRWEDQVAVGGASPEAGQGSISPAAFDGTRLFVAGGQTRIGGIAYPGSVRAIDSATGRYLWEHGAPGAVLGGLATANGFVVDAAGANLEILNASTGQRLLDYPTSSALFDAPTIAQGHIYVGSVAGIVYGFGFSAGRWATPFTPPGLTNASMTFDSADGYTLMFGGCSPSACPSDQTWRWSGSTWVDLTPPIPDPARYPPARMDAALGYDPNSRSVILFGGYVPGAGDLGDTWSYRGGIWSPLNFSSSPSARASASLAFDPDENATVLFGGLQHASAGAQELGDTWELAGGNWSQPHGVSKAGPGKSPSARDSAAIAYDAADLSLVLFGGHCATGALSDTWNLIKGKWASLPTLVQPPALYASVAVYDAKAKEVVLFGGRNATGAVDGSTWVFAAGLWSSVSTKVAPSARASAAGAYDAADSFVLVYGGLGRVGQALVDSWKFNGTVWGALTPLHPGGQRYGAGSAYDARDGYVVVFGGHNPNATIYSDTMRFNGTGYVRLCAGCVAGRNSPLGRYDAAMAYDAADGYVVLFGGLRSGGPVGDTWSFAQGRWTNLTPLHPNASNTPSPRGGARLAYDASDHYLVLFGGSTSAGFVNDTWRFVAGAWTRLNLSTAPSPREGVAMATDSSDGGIVLFGGDAGAAWFGDTWEFRNGTWMPVNVSEGPAARSDAGLTNDLDPEVSALFLVGGFGSGRYLSDVWEFAGGVWTPVYRGSAPSARASIALEFDPLLGGVVMYGGRTGLSGLLSASADTWIFGTGL